MDKLPFAKPTKRKKATPEDKAKRKAYLERHGYRCEICGKHAKEYVHVHHRFLQQHEYREDEDCYVALCMFGCHSKLHASKSQFIEEVKISKCSKFRDYDMEDLYNYLLPNKKML